MAVSTALRLRNRKPIDSVTLLDAISTQSDQERTVLDSIDVNDDIVATYIRKEAGDRLELFSDSIRLYRTRTALELESLETNDSTILEKSQRKTVTETVNVTDEGFITDRDIIRNRVLSDSLEADDNFITNVDAAVRIRSLKDDIVLTDQVSVSVSGIKRKTLLNTVSVIDRIRERVNKTYSDAFDVSDTDQKIRHRNKVLSDTLSVAEVIIVSRNAIVNSSTLIDSLSVTDRITATRIPYTATVSMKIKHGIEIF